MTISLRSHSGGLSQESRSDTAVRLQVCGLGLTRNGKPLAAPENFEVAQGRSLVLSGPSGSGKTTALMALALMHPPATGKIIIDGIEPWRLTARARDNFRGRKIGLIFQSFHLVDALSVKDNIILANRCVGTACDPARLQHLLDLLGIAEISNRRADRISHGQAQRVAVARALINRPALILADEPTSALDDRNANNLILLLNNLATAEGAALVIATHDRRVLDAVSETRMFGGPA